MTERKWFPVAPSVFDPINPGLISAAPTPDTAPPYYIAADFEAAPIVEREPRPIREALAVTHSEIMIERRTLIRELRRPVVRPGVIRSINDRVAFFEDQQERLLNAMVWHDHTVTHQADDCLICDRSVSL